MDRIVREAIEIELHPYKEECRLLGCYTMWLL
jgi:hypothetical protein